MRLRGALWKRENKLYSMIEEYMATVLKVVAAFEEISRSVREGEYHRLQDLYAAINIIVT